MLGLAEKVMQGDYATDHLGQGSRDAGVGGVGYMVFARHPVAAERRLESRLNLRRAPAEGERPMAGGDLVHLKPVTPQPARNLLDVGVRHTEMGGVVLRRQPMTVQIGTGVLLRLDQGVQRSLLHHIRLEQEENVVDSQAGLDGPGLVGGERLGRGVSRQGDPFGVFDRQDDAVVRKDGNPGSVFGGSGQLPESGPGHRQKCGDENRDQAGRLRTLHRRSP